MEIKPISDAKSELTDVGVAAIGLITQMVLAEFEHGVSRNVPPGALVMFVQAQPPLLKHYADNGSPMPDEGLSTINETVARSIRLLVDHHGQVALADGIAKRYNMQIDEWDLKLDRLSTIMM